MGSLVALASGSQVHRYGTRQHHEWQHFEELTFGTDYNHQRAVLKHSMWLTSKKARSKVLQEQDKEEV